MPALINPTAIPLPKSFVPPPVTQPGPGIGPPQRQPTPFPRGQQGGGEAARSYAEYRARLSYIASVVSGFFGSAEWNTYFAPGCGFDNKIQNLFANAPAWNGDTNTNPPDYVMLDNYLPSLALKSVSWISGRGRTVLWVCTTQPDPHAPGPAPRPGPVSIPGFPSPGSSSGAPGPSSSGPFGPVVTPGRIPSVTGRIG